MYKSVPNRGSRTIGCCFGQSYISFSSRAFRSSLFQPIHASGDDLIGFLFMAVTLTIFALVNILIEGHVSATMTSCMPNHNMKPESNGVFVILLTTCARIRFGCSYTYVDLAIILIIVLSCYNNYIFHAWIYDLLQYAAFLNYYLCNNYYDHIIWTLGFMCRWHWGELRLSNAIRPSYKQLISLWWDEHILYWWIRFSVI